MTAATMPREWMRGPHWVSEQARAEWEPVLRGAQAAWSELELASVTEHLRGSALVHLAPGELVHASRDCAGQGLVLTVLEAQASGAYRAAVHWPGPLAAQWHRAWAEHDDEAIGRMLGFPACCRAFFARTWGAGRCDPTPAMETVSGPWEANTLLRQLGVRLVPHLPCSASCAATAAQARAFLEVGRRAGFAVDAIEALLRLPVSYSALNGVAIVETAHFRFMSGASEDAQLRRGGQAEAGPRVVRLPDPGPSAPADPSAPTVWADNGFATEAAMLNAHAVVLAAIAGGSNLRSGGWVWDLGAGDGTLLEEIRKVWPLARCCGVEVDRGRIERGLRRHQHLHLYGGRIEEFGKGTEDGDRLDLVLLMPGRLLEMAPEQAAAVREVLARRAVRLLLYSYNGGLADLAARAGFTLGPIVSGPGAEAALGEVRP